jgi:glutathione-regulated potassium-efflux system ancillary protein KefG
MNKILIIFAHPRFEKSRANRALLNNIAGMPEVTLNDLYEQYPDFNVDINREKELLLAHQIIIWQHPLYMYGSPALLKQWIDLVLEYGWAHGREGDFLKNKIILNTLTAGGTRESYAAGNYNRFTVREFLAPFEQTANLCKMKYLPPFAVHGTHLLTVSELLGIAKLYRTLLEKFAGGEFDAGSINHFVYLNDWLLSEEERSGL